MARFGLLYARGGVWGLAPDGSGKEQRLLSKQWIQRTTALYSPESALPGQVLGEMLGDMREYIWGEVPRGRSIDVYRRNLQRGYLALGDLGDRLLLAELQAISGGSSRFAEQSVEEAVAGDVNAGPDSQRVAMQSVSRKPESFNTPVTGSSMSTPTPFATL